MRLTLLGRRALTSNNRPVPDDLDGTMSPRVAAIRLLAEKIEDGQAGLDPYQPSDFIVAAGANETRWVGIAAALCGAILLRTRQPGGGERFRVVLEADVRQQLGLDTDDPPLMADEPLASRAVDVELMQAKPRLQIVPGEPASLAALRAAKHAAALSYDCQCGAPAGLACGCTDDTRISSPAGRSAS